MCRGRVCGPQHALSPFDYVHLAIVVSGIQRCVCLRTESMNKFQIKGNWNEIKGKLKQKYAQLTDDDLTFAEGKEEELLGRLQKRLGKTDEEIRREIEES